MRVRNMFLILGMVLAFAAAPVSHSLIHAAPVDPLKEVCQKAPSSTACQERDLGGKNPLFGPDGVLTKIINLLSIVVGIVAVIGIMVAGLKYITAGDNPQEVSSARNRVLYACIGLVIAVAAQLMVRLILYKIGQ